MLLARYVARIIRPMQIGKALKLLRDAEGIGLRDMSSRIGISAATLSRMERDKPCDAATFGRVLVFLLQPVAGQEGVADGR